MEIVPMHSNFSFLKNGGKMGKRIRNYDHTRLIADKEKTSQVLTNLLTNAIRYSPEADTVIISGRLNDNEIVCSVKDFGRGIEKVEHTKIFDRFYQVLNVSRSNVGFGLGLYISAQIIKRQNGKRWVESEPGKGSTFHFSLPVNN